MSQFSISVNFWIKNRKTVKPEVKELDQNQLVEVVSESHSCFSSTKAKIYGVGRV